MLTLCLEKFKQNCPKKEVMKKREKKSCDISTESNHRNGYKLSYFNEVITMDDMASVLACTSHSHPRFRCVWICELICCGFFIVLSFANKCTYSIHIDCIPDTVAGIVAMQENARANVCIQQKIEFSCIEINKTRKHFKWKIFSNVNWIVTENCEYGLWRCHAASITNSDIFMCVNFNSAVSNRNRHRRMDKKSSNSKGIATNSDP